MPKPHFFEGGGGGGGYAKDDYDAYFVNIWTLDLLKLSRLSLGLLIYRSRVLFCYRFREKIISTVNEV